MDDQDGYAHRDALRNLYRLRNSALEKGQKPQRFVLSESDSLALRIGFDVPAASLNGSFLLGIPCSDDGASVTALVCYPGV